ncbi:ankyrin repeat-containing domain protein [Aspergillus carlsbadensis]|nr:ankyrin repeat-containing domain protein [Aspergillus carlsbadensis]
MAYQEFHNSTDAVFESRKIIDLDGTPLHETESGCLLRRVITQNGTILLKQYIAAWDLRSAGIPVAEIESHDPFYVAVASGSLDALCLLLDVHRDNANSVSIEERGFTLLNVACAHAQIDIVKFLLDSDPHLGTVNDKDQGGWTPIMSAAYSTGALAAADRVRGEAVMNLLLDRGASARDAVPFPIGINIARGAHPEPQAEFTVLSLAITGSSYGMVKRLLEHGADAQERLRLYSEGSGFWDDGIDVRDVTILHLGSQCWNVDGIRAVLDHSDHDGEGRSKGSDLIYCRDSMGRLPLHWAAAGDDPALEGLRSENTLTGAIAGTFELLVPKDGEATATDLINAQDKKGATPLHYAVSAHARCGKKGSEHAYHTVQWLCSRGGDASIIDCRGQSVLHRLAHPSLDGEPLDLRLIDLLLDHGAPLDYADENGETALHIMARNLRQVAATRILIERGARVGVVNRKGNTPLHEAVRGELRPRLSWDGQRQEGVTLEDRLRAQDEVWQALVDVDGSLMGKANKEGKTPRQLREETRQKWIRM